MDGSLLVDNEGLHGPLEKCATVALTSGSHNVYIEGFQAGGGVYMDAKYYGPDTGEGKILMMSGRASKRYFDSCDPNDKNNWGDVSKFNVCIFKSEVGLGATPRIGDAFATKALSFVGKGQLAVIDIHDVSAFRQCASDTPSSNYAWAIYGGLKIFKEGNYNLCISSDDG
jgi:hypothetical protein